MVAVSLKKNFFQAEDGIRDVERSRGLGDVYKRQVWVRPSRSVMPWKPLTDSRGAVVVKRSRDEADAVAIRAMEGGSMCAWVSETMLPLAPSPSLFAVLVGGERVELLGD